MTSIKWSSQSIAMAILLAALYNAIGLAIPAISFGPIQCRLSDALYPLIALFGLPAVAGLTLGQLIFNFYGFTIGAALGWMDVILSPLIFLIPKLLISRYGFKTVPIHIAAVSLWVPFLISMLYGAPYIPTVASVCIGESVAEGIGIPIAIAIRRRMQTEVLSRTV